MTILDYISIVAIVGLAIYVVARLFLGRWHPQSSDQPVAKKPSRESVSTADEPASH